jgi:hypothetical protein
MGPFEFAPWAPPTAAPIPEAPIAPAPMRTKADSIEVDLDETCRDTEIGEPPNAFSLTPAIHPPPPAFREPALSFVEPPASEQRAALLERAARLGPLRMTWESIVLPSDPILGEKMQPRVAERRARFRKVVTVALGACLALCVTAIGATGVRAIAGGSSDATGSTSASTGRTAPATAFVPVEKIDSVKRGRAHVRAAAFIPPAAPKGKRR